MWWIVACAPEPDEPVPVDLAGMSVLVVLTDDQRADTLWAMEQAQGLAAEAVSFSRAYASVPMCCPARASLLSGGWSPAHLGVTTNEAPNGGATHFVDEDSLAVRFAAAGYATGLVGKYLNEYDDLAPYLPPGWDRFVAHVEPGLWQSWTRAVDGELVEGEGYLPDADGDEALAFLDAHAAEPFFLLVSLPSPHYPWVPAEEDAEAFAGWTWRPPGFAEADVADKAGFADALPLADEAEVADHDADQLAQLRTLLAADRVLGRLLDRLAELDRAEDTIVVFASDNGYLWGEHRVWGKGVPYEESIRVPLLLRIPGVEAREESALVAGNLDLGEALSALAGRPMEGDGIDLFRVATGERGGRESLVLEGRTTGVPAWAAVIAGEQKLVQFSNGASELYDLGADPAELEASAELPETLAQRIDDGRGVSLYVQSLDPGSVGVAYETRLHGAGPIEAWSLYEGELPPGILLEDGWLRGTPTEAGSWPFSVAVESGTPVPYTGAPMRDVAELTLSVDSPPAARPQVQGGRRLRARGLQGPLELSRDGAFDGGQLRLDGEGDAGAWSGLPPGSWTWRVLGTPWSGVVQIEAGPQP